MNTPWFFLSYAGLDHEYNQHVEKFFSKLLKTVRWVGQLKEKKFPDEDIGFCALHMLEGTIWPAELWDKLNSCGVLVCLYSEAYFNSEHCGQEFEIFRNRLNNHTDKGAPARIIPVLWVVEKDFDETYLPTALEPIHYKCSGFEDAVNQGGIFSYLAIHANNPTEYDKYVRSLAGRIVDAVRGNPELPPLRDAVNFETTVNAFAGYSGRRSKVLKNSSEPQTNPAQIDFSAEPISPTKIKLRWKGDASINVKIERRSKSKDEFTVLEVDIGETEYVDSGLRPAATYVYKISLADTVNGHTRFTTATAKTLPIPTLWYIIVAGVLLSIASLAFVFRCNIPGICKNEVVTSTASAAQPVIEKEYWPDHFDRKLGAGPNIWLQSGEWNYPKDDWTTTEGKDKSDSDRALVVGGPTPGLTTRNFDNFTANFSVSYLSGNKAGWFLRADEAAKVGYKFLLVKPENPEDEFTLTVTPVGSPGSQFLTNACSVRIPEYGKKPDDFIEINVTANNNKFSCNFTLENPKPLDDDREAIKDPQPVGCSNSFKDEGTYLKYGRLGFFAVDGTIFKVEFVTVTPLKQN